MNATLNRFLGLVLVLMVLFTAPVYAQTTLTQTTLSSAVTAAADRIVVASATGFTVGNRVYIWTAGKLEGGTIGSISGTTITLRERGLNSIRQPHPSGSIVFTGPASRFFGSDPVGSCVDATTIAPYINVVDANIFYCLNSKWAQTVNRGFANIGSNTVYTYTSAGALYIAPGVHHVNGTTLAMTLAAPTKDQNGLIMTIIAANASAHTVTYTAGFSGTTTSSDVGTFGGAVNDNLVIIAIDGVWRVISTRNVTIA